MPAAASAREPTEVVEVDDPEGERERRPAGRALWPVHISASVEALAAAATASRPGGPCDSFIA
jgi:hypothetical protein